MKPFTLYRIIILLFIFSANNLFAVKPATIEQSQIESAITLSSTKKITKKTKRKARLIEKIKAKLNHIFSKDSAQENTNQSGNLETKTHGLAVASLVLGILGILTAILGIGLLLSLLALIFGAVSDGKIKKSGGFYTGKGMARAGLILGIIPLAVFVIVLSIALLTGGF